MVAASGNRLAGAIQASPHIGSVSDADSVASAEHLQDHFVPTVELIKQNGKECSLSEKESARYICGSWLLYVFRISQFSQFHSNDHFDDGPIIASSVEHLIFVQSPKSGLSPTPRANPVLAGHIRLCLQLGKGKTFVIKQTRTSRNPN
jgi:hypothetical protein